MIRDFQDLIRATFYGLHVHCTYAQLYDIFPITTSRFTRSFSNFAQFRPPWFLTRRFSFLFVSLLSRDSFMEVICMDSWRFSRATKNKKLPYGDHFWAGKKRTSGGRSIENG
jgi:hypothetical protein